MAKNKRRKVKVKTGYKLEQRKGKNARVDKILKHVEGIEFNVSPDLILFNDRTIGYFYSRNRKVKKK